MSIETQIPETAMSCVSLGSEREGGTLRLKTFKWEIEAEVGSVVFGEERRCSEAASQIDFTSAWRERERECVCMCVCWVQVIQWRKHELVLQRLESCTQR